MSKLSKDDVHDIQEQFRQFPHYPRLLELSTEYKISVNDVLNAVNQNPRVGAFLYRHSVYTWRHVRQFEYMVNSGTPITDVLRYFGIGSSDGQKLMERKVRELKKNEGREPLKPKQEVKKEVEDKKELASYQLTDMDKKVIELSKTGMSQLKIGQELGVSKSTIYQVQKTLKSLGYISTEEILEKRKENTKPKPVVTQRTDYKLSDIEKTIVELYNAGEPNKNIWEAVGCKKTKLSDILKKLRDNGIINERTAHVSQKPKAEEPKAEESKEDVAEEYDAVKSETADKYDVPKEPKETERKEVPDNKRKYLPDTKNKEEQDGHFIKVSRSERIDKLADEIVQKLKISQSAVGRAMTVARNAVEYAFRFGDVLNYTITGDDTAVTINLHGESYDFALHRSF